MATLRLGKGFEVVECVVSVADGACGVIVFVTGVGNLMWGGDVLAGRGGDE